jgi:hypothetical protein
MSDGADGRTISMSQDRLDAIIASRIARLSGRIAELESRLFDPARGPEPRRRARARVAWAAW